MAEIVCDFLRDCDLAPVGPASSLEDALQQARESRLDGAILDVKLRNRFCFPICSILTARRIPFLFLTGYKELSLIPADCRGVAMICKPFEPADMKDALIAMLGLSDDSPPDGIHHGPGLRH